jgi:hypothetical protein
LLRQPDRGLLEPGFSSVNSIQSGAGDRHTIAYRPDLGSCETISP